MIQNAVPWKRSFPVHPAIWSDFSYDGSFLYVKFIRKSEVTVQGGFDFTARSYFESVTEVDAVKNLQAFFGQLIEETHKTSADSNQSDVGLNFLIPLLESKDLLTRQWATIAYADISAYSGKMVDIYKGRRPPTEASRTGKGANDTGKFPVAESGKGVVETPIVKSRDTYDTISATEKLYDASGLEFAARMAVDHDRTIRWQGCKVLSRLLLCKEGRSQMVNGGTWRTLLDDSLFSSDSQVKVKSFFVLFSEEG